jgi:hypothetical protein
MRHWILLAVMVATLWFAAALAQQPSPVKDGLKRFERFFGSVRSGGSERRVAIHVWLIPNDRKVEDLERPFRGLTVVEVRGGSVYAAEGGERKRRLAGEFWTVPTNGKVAFETREDSAAVQTTVVGE